MTAPAPAFAYFRLWLAIGVFMAAGILYGCLAPTPSVPGGHGLDKLEHALAMAILTLWFGALFRTRSIGVVAAIVAYGGAIELLQMALVYRDPSFFDWLADIAGVAVGLVLVLLGAMDWLSRLDAHVTAANNRTRGGG